MFESWHVGAGGGFGGSQNFRFKFFEEVSTRYAQGLRPWAGDFIVKRLRDTAAQETLVRLMKSLRYHGLTQDLDKF